MQRIEIGRNPGKIDYRIKIAIRTLSKAERNVNINAGGIADLEHNPMQLGIRK
jgi:hypothetical protein